MRITARARAVVLCSSLSLLPVAPRVGAQGYALVPAGPNTLSGIVVDTLGRPLSDASVFVERLQRHVRTRADGRYLFDKVKPGLYTVIARRIGFVGESREVTVGGRGGAAPAHRRPRNCQCAGHAKLEVHRIRCRANDAPDHEA